MIKKKTIKKLKPIDNDIHFKYLCPNNDCLDIHWLSLKETQTKNFIVVCDCGETFKPKRIKGITINYCENKKTAQVDNQEQPDIIKQDLSFLEEAKKTLILFGFRKEEAETMIEDEYSRTEETNPATLVKLSLDFLKGK